MIVYVICLQAQLIVNGHVALYDQKTATWLVSISEQHFENDVNLPVSLQTEWQQLYINDESVSDHYTFHNITAESAYAVRMVHNDGHQVEGTIRFTFLPLVCIEGTFGYEYQDATVTIINANHSVDDVYSARIKWRGGTTNGLDKHKRNYSIKFTNDVQLFDMRSDNNWMLDAGQADVFRLRNRIAMDIWNDMATKPYYADQEPKALNGVKGRVIEVFLNDEYRGIYNLSEKLDRKQMKLKKVGMNGDIHGVLYKGVSFNNTSMNDSIYQYNNYSETLFGYEAKYPEPGDDNDSTDWRPLVDALNRTLILAYDSEQFEQEIAEWFDIPVMVDYSVFLSSVNALDNSGKNMFWAIYDKETTKRLTPAPWDLDCTFGQRWGGKLTEGDPSHASPAYLSDVVVSVFWLLYRDNALQFNDQLNERYQQLRQPGNILATDSLISRFTYYYQILKKSGAAKRETAKWSQDTDLVGEVIDFDYEYDYICNWIDQHLSIIDYRGFPVYYFNEKGTDVSVNLLHVQNTQQNAIYTLSGQRLDQRAMPRHGIYIVNGRKVVIR